MPSLKKNLAINLSYQLFAVLMPLIVAPYVTRTIGPEGAGVYAFSFSIAACFALLGMLGIANYGSRTVASAENSVEARSEVFWNIWAIQLVCTAGACLLYLAYCLLFFKGDRTIALIQTVTVLCSAFDISWFFFGLEKFQVTVARNVVVKLLNLALIFLLVKSEEDLVTYVLIMVLGSLLNCLLLFLFLRRELVFVRPRRETVRRHIKPIVVLFFPVVAISIYKLMDKVMLGYLAQTAETGYYEYAEKIIGLPGTVITAIGAVMLPRLSNVIGRSDRKQAAFLLEATIEVMMFLTIGMAAGIFCVGEDFAPFFFGERFTKSGLVMMALAPSVVCQGWANVLRTEYLIPEKKDAVYVKSTWLGALVNLTMNALLIPRLQAVGAALGTVCAEAAVAVYQSVWAAKELPLPVYLRRAAYYLAPALGMWLAVGLVRRAVGGSSFGKLLAEMLTGLLVYLLLSAPCALRRLRMLKESREKL